MKRFIAKALRKLTGAAEPTSISDNQDYPQVCLQASRDERAFAEFRRNPVYNQILEHVPEEQGRAYLQLIARDMALNGALARFRKNDLYGNPRTFEYPGAGRFSPTTLRYVKVLADLKALFGSLDGAEICEIGVGYGGQCRVICEWFKPGGYTLVDIAPALALAQRYLGNYGLATPLRFETMDQLAPRDYGLAISNYAFTELRRPLQEAYLEKVLLHAKRGYITYNEVTPPEFKSYKVGELLERIAGARRIEEQPLTYPGNCIIAWGG